MCFYRIQPSLHPLCSEFNTRFQTRMSSTLVSSSGNKYTRDKILKAHTNSEMNIWLAHCQGHPFVLKPVSDSILEQSILLQKLFSDTRQLRHHVDIHNNDRVLIYEYFTHDILSFVRDNPQLFIKSRKHILREVGKAIERLHAKDWIHLDIKPDNVMINCSDNSGQLQIERAVLSDLDCALKLEGDRLLDARIGNVMWRSPEGQVGKGIGKPSDIFSYGLLCLYVVTGMETLHPDFRELKELGIEPELEIMGRLITFFGPVPSGLIAHVNNERWGTLMIELSMATADDLSMQFNEWKEEMFPNLDSKTKRFILSMTQLDPGKRATISQVMEDSWWSDTD
ncbi:kinase-like domain-containing protein [Aspergillus californicus]